jgi:hypothetical protein
MRYGDHDALDLMVAPSLPRLQVKWMQMTQVVVEKLNDAATESFVAGG